MSHQQQAMPVIYIMCVLAFLLFAYDKHCAVYSKFRIPEWMHR